VYRTLDEAYAELMALAEKDSKPLAPSSASSPQRFVSLADEEADADTDSGEYWAIGGH
jgi:hypothetical protein